MKKTVDFRILFTEQELLLGNEKSAVDFFKLAKTELNYGKDKVVLDHLSIIAQALESKALLGELDSLGVPCDTLQLRTVVCDDEGEYEEIYINRVFSKDFQNDLQPPEYLFITPSEMMKEEFQDDIYEQITKNKDSVFTASEFNVFRVLKFETEKRYKQTFNGSIADKLYNKSFAFTENEMVAMASNILNKIKTNEKEILYSVIDEKSPIKEKIVNYFEQNSFYISNGESNSPSKSIMEALSDYKYYTNNISSTYIQNEKDNEILVTVPFFGSRTEIDFFNDAVNMVKKQLLKTYDENLNEVINQDLLGTNGGAVVVFKDKTPIAIFTVDDFENKIIKLDDLEGHKTINSANLIRELESESSPKKEEIIKKINSIYEEKLILEYTPNKFEAEVGNTQEFNTIREKLKDTGSLIGYVSKEESGAGKVVVYSELNQNNLLESLKDLPNIDALEKELKKVSTDFRDVKIDDETNTNKTTRKMR